MSGISFRKYLYCDESSRLPAGVEEFVTMFLGLNVGGVSMFKNALFALCVAALVVGAFVAPAHAQAPRPQDWKIGVTITANREDGKKAGVKIVSVFKDSPAEEKELKKGDVIHAIDGTLFDDPKAVRD